jgi:SAM-dependent methyltransferase
MKHDSIITHNIPPAQSRIDSLIRHTLQGSRVIADLGAAEPLHKWLSAFKDDIRGGYFCMDIQHNPRLDFVGDLGSLPVKDESIDAVICWSVLEHVYEPQQCVREIRRVLKKNGTGLFQLPFFYPCHGTEHSVDCYRFTIHGLKYMFSSFKKVEIFPQDDYAHVLARMLFGFSKKPLLMMLQNMVSALLHACLMMSGKKLNAANNTSGFFIHAIK